MLTSSLFLYINPVIAFLFSFCWTMTDAADVIPKKRVKKPSKKKKQALLEEVVTVEAQGVIPRAELTAPDASPPFIPDPKTEKPEPDVIDMEEREAALQTLLQLKSQPSPPLKDV